MQASIKAAKRVGGPGERLMCTIAVPDPTVMPPNRCSYHARIRRPPTYVQTTP